MFVGEWTGNLVSAFNNLHAATIFSTYSDQEIAVDCEYK